MNPKYRRLIVVVLILSTLGLATKLILMALKDNIIYFYSPNDLKLKYGKIENIKNVIRVGGLVLEESVIIKGNKTIFEITDRTHQIKVSFDGSLPDLFREGQGIVVEGEFIDNKLIANQVLAKHDENYMPPEVADALMRNGVWQGGKKN
ncbi:MAG: cytochrome c maturation protein CcmE [Candidatus Puniceispirillales bacterium]|jgi:cytochrome c-type biogenesis protein CcmE|nr:cytochrome c maturation protein CcmE [Alphaproteobacteria bacterium]|tara:strand:+ start:269 stop:715 length:447 start_codon:yes stop_codon:yes gene_type:complete